jgi:hypothetical protein
LKATARAQQTFFSEYGLPLLMADALGNLTPRRQSGGKYLALGSSVSFRLPPAVWMRARN